MMVYQIGPGDQNASDWLQTKLGANGITIREKRRRERERKHRKSMIWLIEWAKMIVRHAFWCNFLT